MITSASSLREVAATIAHALAARGVTVVVVGASAITAHAHHVHNAQTLDFAVPSGLKTAVIEETLAGLGFAPSGGLFYSASSPFSIRFVAEMPRVHERTITNYETIDTRHGPFFALSIEDAVADRIAAYLFAHDSQSLAVAERALETLNTQIDRSVLKRIVDTFDGQSERATQRRLAFLRDRLWLGKPQT